MDNVMLPEMKKVVFGTNRELYTEKGKLAIEKVIMFPEDGKPIIVDLVNYSDEVKEEKLDKLSKSLKSAGVNATDNYFTDSKSFVHYYDKALKAQVKKDNSKLKAALIGLGITAGVVGVGSAVGIGAYNLANKGISVEDADDKLADVPDISDKDWQFYLDNALDTTQKEVFQDRITKWLTSVNGKEDWEKATLTEDKMKELGYDSKNCLYGFTAEEAYSLMLRFGNYSDSEYTSITGGKSIDVVKVMDDAHSSSNGALASIIYYYINSDECDLNIDKLINFSDKEVDKINEIEGLLREYKELEADNTKTGEAEAKMHEIKSWLNEYAHDVDYEQSNAKSYILRTFVQAASIISVKHDYTDQTEIEVYDKTAGVNVSKQITTQLFDEMMIRDLVTGYLYSNDNEMFDSASYLEEHGISSDRYQLMMSDVAMSIADKSCSSQSEKLQQANDFMARLRQNDSLAEAAYAATKDIKIDLNDTNNVITDWDKLVNGTYDSSVLIEKLNDYLVEKEIYPENTMYFLKEKAVQDYIDYLDNNGVTAGKPGDFIETETEKSVPVTPSEMTQENATVLNHENQVVTPEQAMEEARQENYEKTDIYDASTPEAESKVEEEVRKSDDFQARMNLLQGVYNATFNHVVGSSVVTDTVDTSNTYGQVYTDSWANSSDQDIVFNYNLATEDAKKYLNDLSHNGETIEEDVTINPEYKDAEIYPDSQAPVESVDKKTNDENTSTIETPTEVATPSNPTDTVKPSEPKQDNTSTNDTPSKDNNNDKPFEGITDKEPVNYAPAVDDNTTVTPDTGNSDIINIEDMTDEELEEFLKHLNNTLNSTSEQSMSDSNETVNDSSNVMVDDNATLTSDNQVVDGIVSEAPTGYAPVVDNIEGENNINYSSSFDVESMTDEELEQFISALNNTVDSEEQVKTK